MRTTVANTRCKINELRVGSDQIFRQDRGKVILAQKTDRQSQGFQKSENFLLVRKTIRWKSSWLRWAKLYFVIGFRKSHHPGKTNRIW